LLCIKNVELFNIILKKFHLMLILQVTLLRFMLMLKRTTATYQWLGEMEAPFLAKPDGGRFNQQILAV